MTEGDCLCDKFPMIFLVFEGLDGSGKSSLMRALQGLLDQKKISYHVTREPGGTPLGDQLREMILRKSGPTPTPRTELLLYEASRSQHVDEVILPEIKKGKWVLCDRFSASSIAFQAGGRNISEQDVEQLNAFATNNLKPHLTILLDLSVEDSKKRRQSRAQSTGESEDRIESEKDDFHNRVRQSFLKQAQKQKTEWLVLDANQSTEQMLELLVQELRSRGWLG